VLDQCPDVAREYPLLVYAGGMRKKKPEERAGQFFRDDLVLGRSIRLY